MVFMAQSNAGVFMLPELIKIFFFREALYICIYNPNRFDGLGVILEKITLISNAI